MKTLHTNRLLLRRFEYSDLDDFYDYAKDPEVGPNAGWPAHSNKRESKKILAQMIRTKNTWAIVEKSSGTTIGSISAVVDGVRVGLPGYYDIGYAIGRLWWGKGYATEATLAVMEHLFTREKAVMLTARHRPSNLRSRRVIEKCGFSYEGTLRHTGTDLTGKIVDTSYYSVVADEFWEHKKTLEAQRETL